jgi:hypothetical protein
MGVDIACFSTRNFTGKYDCEKLLSAIEVNNNMRSAFSFIISIFLVFQQLLLVFSFNSNTNRRKNIRLTLTFKGTFDEMPFCVDERHLCLY